MYTATASLYVYSDSERPSGSAITQSELTASKTLVDTYIVILKSNTVIDAIIDDLNLQISTNDLKKMISASSLNGTEAFSVSVTTDDPELSQRIVNSLISIVPNEIVRIVKAGGAEIIDTAKTPTSPSSPSIARNVAIGALIGLLLSFGVFFIIFMSDTVVHTENDLDLNFDIPVLGIVPELIADKENVK